MLSEHSGVWTIFSAAEPCLYKSCTEKSHCLHRYANFSCRHRGTQSALSPPGDAQASHSQVDKGEQRILAHHASAACGAGLRGRRAQRPLPLAQPLCQGRSMRITQFSVLFLLWGAFKGRQNTARLLLGTTPGVPARFLSQGPQLGTLGQRISADPSDSPDLSGKHRFGTAEFPISTRAQRASPNEPAAIGG